RTLLYYFLRDFICVDEETAQNDSCQMEHLMSPQTSEKFFNFMKTLACTCEDLSKNGQLPKSFQFKTTLDLCSYSTSDEFIHQQKGDSHLQGK
ncbi:MAG: iron dependent repressor, metal binding and dimerization domain protein, partial [Bacteriovorax sp.]